MQVAGLPVSIGLIAIDLEASFHGVRLAARDGTPAARPAEAMAAR
jgi:hypothetical protein